MKFLALFVLVLLMLGVVPAAEAQDGAAFAQVGMEKTELEITNDCSTFLLAVMLENGVDEVICGEIQRPDLIGNPEAVDLVWRMYYPFGQTECECVLPERYHEFQLTENAYGLTFVMPNDDLVHVISVGDQMILGLDHGLRVVDTFSR